MPPRGEATGLPEATLPAQRAGLVRLCARLTGDAEAAEDLAQETLAEAWRQRHKLRDPEGQTPWLAAIARNVCLRWARRRGRDLARRGHVDRDGIAATGDLDDWPAESADPTADLERAELARLLDRALAMVPPEARAVLLERYVRESPPAEVAARLGLSEGAAHKRLQRGRLALRRVLTTELREAATACGLPLPDTGGWEETRIWCPTCGRRRLLGRFERPDGLLAFRCPDCTPEPGTASEFPLANPTYGRLLAGVARYKPALTRAYAWVDGYYRRGLAEGLVACTNCGRPAPLRWVQPLQPAPATEPLPRLAAQCASCGECAVTSLGGLVLALPAVRRFWREHSRMRLLPAREVEVEGRAALVSRVESVTDGASLEVISARETYAVLAVHGDGPADFRAADPA